MRRTKRITNYFCLIIILAAVIVQVGICSADTDKYTVMRRIQKTVQIIEEQKQSGKLEPSKIIPLMKKVQKNFKAGNLKRANKLLDEVNMRLSKSTNEESKVAVKHPMIYSPYEKINIINGTVNNGKGDPSIEYSPDGTGWLTYTSVDVKNSVLITHLAKSTDKGKTWKFVKIINHPLPDMVDGIKGNWVHETTSIVYDPDDAGKEWKIFWFRYFRAKGSIAKNKEHTWLNSLIAYKYASNPEGRWSEEIPVFGMGNFRNKGVDLSSLHPDLKDLVFYYELGSLYKDGTLYLSLEGSAAPTGKGEWNKKKIILLASNDHGKTWKYVGTLTDYNDAKNSGYLTFTASSLVEEKGRIFLLVSPSGKLSNLRDPEGHHDGINIFEFEDITKAKLKRDNKGKLILIKHIDDNLEKGGQGDYDEQNTYGGIVIPQQDLKYFPEVFQLFSTKEKIVD